MEIVFLKTGKFSVHPARGPVISCTKGEHCVVEDKDGEALIAYGQAEKVVEDGWRHIPKPWLDEGWDPKSRKAKDKLIAYGADVLGVRVDRRKRIKTIIRELEELLAK